MEHLEKEERQFVQFGPEIVAHLAESVGIPSLTPVAARELSEDVAYRIRMLASVSEKFCRHSKRKVLTVQDLERAMEVCNVEPVFGHGSGGLNEQGYTKIFDTTQTGVVRNPATFFVPDEQIIDLREVALAPPTNYFPRKSFIQGSWLALEGGPIPDRHGNCSVLLPLKEKFDSQVAPYVKSILIGLLGNNEEVIKAVIEDVRNNTKISLFLPGLISFSRHAVFNHPLNPTIRLRVLSLLKAIVSNINVNLSPHPYLNLILRTIIHTLIQDRNFQGSWNHSSVEFCDDGFHATSLIIRNLILLWGDFFSELKADCIHYLVGILDIRNKYSLSATCSAVYAISYLGPRVIEDHLLPCLEDISGRILKEHERILKSDNEERLTNELRKSSLNYFEKITVQAARIWINFLNSERRGHKPEMLIWYEEMYELFGDSLNICHLPVFQTKEYKFKVDWALGQKDKLPSSKMSCEKSPTEDSLFQANDDFEFFSLADLGPDLLTHPQTETTRASSNIKTSLIIEPMYVDEELIHVFEHNQRRIVKKDSKILFNFGMLTWPHEKLKKKKMSLLESPVSTSSFTCGPKALIKKSGNFQTQKRSKWSLICGYSVESVFL